MPALPQHVPSGDSGDEQHTPSASTATPVPLHTPHASSAPVQQLPSAANTAPLPQHTPVSALTAFMQQWPATSTTPPHGTLYDVFTTSHVGPIQPVPHPHWPDATSHTAFADTLATQAAVVVHPHATPVSHSCVEGPGVAPVAVHALAGATDPLNATQPTARVDTPTPHPVGLTHSDQPPYDQEYTRSGQRKRLQGAVVGGGATPAATHTLSFAGALPTMHVGGGRDVTPRLASEPFMHGEEHGCHCREADQYVAAHGAVLHGCTVAGGVTAAHRDVLYCTAPSRRQERARNCSPPPHGALHGDHAEVP